MIYLRFCENAVFEGDTFSKNAQGIAIIMHWTLLLTNFCHRKSQIRIENRSFYVMCCSINLNLAGGEEYWGFIKFISIFLKFINGKANED